MASAVFEITVKDDGTAKVKDFKKSLKGLNKNVKEVGTSANTSKTSLEKLAHTIGTAFVMGNVYKAIGKFNSMLTTSTDSVLKFQDTLKTIQGVTGTSGKDLSELSRISRDVGNSTEFSSDKIIDVALAYKRMGVELQDIPNMLKTTADLMSITGAEQETVINVLNSSINAYKKTSKDAVSVSNMLQNTVSNSATDFEELGESLKYSTFFARKAEIPMEKLLALTGSLANVGLKGTVSGTSIKNLLQPIIAGSSKFKQAVKKYKVSGTDMLDLISKLVNKASTSEISDIFNLRGISSAFELGELTKKIKEGVNEFQHLEDKVVSTENTVADMAKTARESWLKQLQIFGSNFQNLLIDLSQGFAKFTGKSDSPIKVLNEALKNLIREVNEGSPRLTQFYTTVQKLLTISKELTHVFLGFTSMFGKFLTSLGDLSNIEGFVITMASATAGLTTLGKTTKALVVSNPFGALATAITVAGASIIAQIDKWNARMDKTMSLWAQYTEEAINMTNTPLENAQQRLYGEFFKNEKKFYDRIVDLQKKFTNTSDEVWKNYYRKAFEKEAGTKEKGLLGFLGITKSSLDITKELPDYETFLNHIGISQKKVSDVLKREFKALGLASDGLESSVEGFFKGKRTRTIQDVVGFFESLKRTYVAKAEETAKDVKGKGKTITWEDLIGDSSEKEKSKKYLADYFGIVDYFSKEAVDSLKKSGFVTIFADNSKEIEVTAKNDTEALSKIKKAWEQLNKMDMSQYLTFLKEASSSLSKNIATDSVESFVDSLEKMSSFRGEFLGTALKQLDPEKFSQLSTAINKLNLKDFQSQYNKVITSSKNKLNQLGQSFRGLFDFGAPQAWSINNATKETIKSLEVLKDRAKGLGLDQEFIKIGNVIEQLNNERLKTFWQTVTGYLSQTIDLAQTVVNHFSFLGNEKMRQLQEEHDKELELMGLRKDVALKNAGENAKRQAMIANDMYKQEVALRKKLDAEKQKAFEENKKWQYATALMGALQMGINAFNSTHGDVISRWLSVGSAVAYGTSQAMQINATRMAGGGGVSDHLNMGNADKYPLLVTGREYIVSAPEVEKQGGYHGVEQALDMAKSGFNRSGGIVNKFYTDTLIGTEEFVNDMFYKLAKKERTWLG